jgi:hypothetical protein
VDPFQFFHWKGIGLKNVRLNKLVACINLLGPSRAAFTREAENVS